MNYCNETINDRYFIYKHTAPNGMNYIGMTCRSNPRLRWGRNGNKYCDNKRFYNDIQKYGWDNFSHDILYNNLTKEEAEQKEIELIAYYKSNQQEYGHNIKKGGNAMSEDTKQKIGNANRNKVRSDKLKHYLSEMFKGRKLTPEWTTKRAYAQTGLKRSEETRRKISERSSQKIICLNNRKTYDSLTKAAESTNANIGHISSCCSFQRHSSGTDNDGNALVWMKYQEYLDNDLYNCSIEKTFSFHNNRYNNMKEKLKNKPKKNRGKPVICLETKEVYSSIKQASEKTGIRVSCISSCCHYRYEYTVKDNKISHWLFYDEYLKIREGE